MSFGNESGGNNQKMSKAGKFIACKGTNYEGRLTVWNHWAGEPQPLLEQVTGDPESVVLLSAAGSGWFIFSASAFAFPYFNSQPTML